MTRATFFKHFELLAGQPDAVAKMRELVLQLAIQGKLLVCDPKDTTARRIPATARRRERHAGEIETRIAKSIGTMSAEKVRCCLRGSSSVGATCL